MVLLVVLTTVALVVFEAFMGRVALVELLVPFVVKLDALDPFEALLVTFWSSGVMVPFEVELVPLVAFVALTVPLVALVLFTLMVIVLFLTTNFLNYNWV